MYCPRCRISAKGDFCPECGGPTILDKVVCPECEAVNYVWSKFCEHCGRPIQEVGESFVKEQLEKSEGEEVK